MPERVSKTNYYLDIAETVSERSTCLRKHYGAIIVKNDVIVATGYTVRRAEERTASILEPVSAKSLRFRAENGMSFAVPFMRKQTRLSQLPVIRCSARRCIWYAWIRPTDRSSAVRRAA